MTPSTGACQAKRLPSGDNFGSTREGLPSSRLRGIKVHSSVFEPVIDTVNLVHSPDRIQPASPAMIGGAARII